VAIAVTAEHEELRRAVRRWLDTHCPPAVPRAALEAPADKLPGVWDELAGQGWLGLHVAEEHGGQGFGLLELAVTLEELAHALVPGPVLPTVLVAAVVSGAGTDELQAAVLPALVTGRWPAAVHLGADRLEARSGAGGVLRVRGVLRAVLGAPTARLVLAPLHDGGWCLADVGGDAPGPRVEPSVALDPTRPIGVVTFDDVALPRERILPVLGPASVHDLALALSAAEAAGGARWCLETGAAHAKERVQFGRPIGQFQAVKHKLADLLVVVEQIAATAWDAAAAWDAARDGAPVAEAAQASAVAGAIALDGYLRCAKDCIQVLGGIGFTWEHDAHLHLRRAVATRQLLTDPSRLVQQVCASALAGTRRTLAGDLPEGAEELRAELGPLVAATAALPAAEQRRRLVDSGLMAPHWPRPWGRDAGPLEQVVIDEELAAAGVLRPNLSVGAWALPTLIAHGDAAQQERWVGPTLRGEISWCQLFSEPGAGSDLAGLSTRAERVDGGWVITGQKVWTSMAQSADWGICLARTDPSAPKHAGITFFVVDMRAPGIDVRPLRELTGAAMFNEVFLDEVFVPDDCVVGTVGDGWRVGRTTLANERVSMSSGSTYGVGVESVLRGLSRLGDDAPPGSDLAVGALLVEAQSLRLMAQRVTLRSLSGLDLGATASVRKLAGVEHEQRVQETGLALQGPAGAVVEGRAERWQQGFLFTRCLTIAGGTSEVQRNVIAERLLGLPKDPEPGS
jgi:alkylation response protein AidB-like acyl-CoA dehydrogenase